MSLAKRLNEMERRLRELEEWKAGIEQAIVEESEAAEDEDPQPTTLDGESAGGERDQTQSLG